MLSKFGLLVMRLTAFLPLSLVRALGAVLGLLLYAFAWERRRVTRVNLQVCFPKKNAFELKELMKKNVYKVRTSLVRSELVMAWTFGLNSI